VGCGDEFGCLIFLLQTATTLAVILFMPIKHGRQAIQLLTHLGPSWAVFRLRYALRKKSGALVWRTPLGSWANNRVAKEAGREPALFRSRVAVGHGCVSEAEAILKGSFRLFSFHQKATEFPPSWHRNPITGENAPAEAHWSQIGDFSSGDIKGVWELSRFPWAWPLARAFDRTGDERFAEAFWVLFEDWLACNPPNHGANWMCGQEATFRLMAATFARQVSDKAGATTPARVARFQEFVQATARRIAANIDYALSQSNNHGVSECIGLVTAAVILPDDTESDAWRVVGLRALQGQLDALVYADGAFAQHSANYHRVLLHDLLWGIALLRTAGLEVPGWWLGAARRALSFIDELITPMTGRVPLYGANDGANILPLADADYLDFRPLVQAGFALLHGVRRFEPGPWDEAAQWLAPEWRRTVGRQTTDDGGDSKLKAESPEQKAKGQGSEDDERKVHAHFPDAGVAIWRTADLRVFLRCPEKFLHRPSQADLMHVDLEWRRQPITIDAGTFCYNTSGPLSGAMKEAAVHNSVTFDDAEPLAKAGRFLYLPWPKGTAEMRRDDGGAYFEATHDGWAKHGAGHVRQCRIAGPDSFVIFDRLSKRCMGKARLHWLLADVPYNFDANAGRLVLHTVQGDYAIKWKVPADSVRATLVRADPTSARGWWSPYYFHAAPALSLSVEFNFSGNIDVTTNFAPA
jgi:hypothetical protein